MSIQAYCREPQGSQGLLDPEANRLLMLPFVFGVAESRQKKRANPWRLTLPLISFGSGAKI